MKRWLGVVGGALLIGALAIFALGSARYGGPDGLLLRVQAEIAAQRPRPAFVPTPLPMATRREARATVPPPLTPTSTYTATATVMAAAGTTAPLTSTPLSVPKSSPTVTASPAPAEVLTLAMPGPREELTGLRHAWQTWNNCGPATLSMYLSFWGQTTGQEEIRRVVRPNPEDKHAGPEELAAVARGRGLNALVRVDGSAKTLRMFVVNGLPVMISTWHEDEPGDGMGHYRLIVGYDGETREWLLYDSLAATARDRNAPYEPLRLPYDALEQLWKVFNRRFLVVYPDVLAETAHAILGEQIDDDAMWEGALARAYDELAQDDANPFHWFNLGTDLVALGRYEEAASAYDRARQLGLPWRMLWYQFGPFSAYYGVGRYDEVIALADATLRLTTHLEELHYWRGMALAALGDVRAAKASLGRALQLRPGYPEASQALRDLG